MQKVYRSEKQMHNEHKACHSRRETLMTSSSRDLKVSGKPDAVLSCPSELGPNTFSERNQSNEPGNRFENSVHSVFRVAEPSSAGKSLLDGNKDHLLNQARSELMKQEYQVGSLNNCINEVQQQAYAQRLELEDAHHGYVESRQEQVRLQEDLVMKETALRDAHIRSMHEMREMKRAQELRVEEFSVQKLKESHETIQVLKKFHATWTGQGSYHTQYLQTRSHAIVVRERCA